MCFERQVEKRGENVSLGMTNKVSAERCCLYQLFPHCVWLSRRWGAQRCPQGLQRRRTGRGALRDKNLISLQPFDASPSIPSSSHPGRRTEWYYTYMKRKEKACPSPNSVSDGGKAEQDESFVGSPPCMASFFHDALHPHESQVKVINARHTRVEASHPGSNHICTYPSN